MQPSYVYVMKASNNLVKIGKANDVNGRRTKLEQGVNIFNAGKQFEINIIKQYPMYDARYALRLEQHLHRHFADYAIPYSNEVFSVSVDEVIKIADICYDAFLSVQMMRHPEFLLKRKRSWSNGEILVSISPSDNEWHYLEYDLTTGEKNNDIKFLSLSIALIHSLKQLNSRYGL